VSELSTPSARPRPGWLIPVVAIGVVVLILVISFSSSYNGMVKKRNAVNQQFAQVDTELQRQFDLIPNVVASVRGAQAQEQTVFNDIAQARTQYAGANSNDQKVDAANNLQSAISRLLVIQEAYPDLQSNQLVQNLITELEGSQNRITQERRQYNDVVTSYNNSIQTFPRNIAAGIFGFHTKTLFNATTQAETTTPTVQLTPLPPTTAAAGQ
jgi:LemA protein